MIELSEESEADWWDVEALFDLCFGPGREALSSYRLRDWADPVAGLSQVARDSDQTLAGAIRYWPVRVAGQKTLLLGPVAVHPTRQGEGLGGFMIRESLEIARKKSWTRVMLIGDAPYYGRFGFSRLDQVIMPPPTNQARVLGLSLVGVAWDGVRGNVVKF
ncbi:MAG: GNAT family N-acetyltransferase [Halocynthiibacter sp.]